MQVSKDIKDQKIIFVLIGGGFNRGGPSGMRGRGGRGRGDFIQRGDRGAGRGGMPMRGNFTEKSM